MVKRDREKDLHAKATYLPDTHRLLPQSIDAERGVISSFLISGKTVGALCIEKNVTEECFHLPAHRDIFVILMDAWNDAKPLDFILLTQTLRDRGQLDRVGGPGLVTELFTFLPTAANAEYYIDILLAKYRRREIVRVGTEYAARSYEDAEDDDELIDGFEKSSLSIRTIRRSARKSMRDLMVESLSDIDAAYDRKGAIGGISYGFSDLDKLTDGMKPEEFIVLGGRPSMGKTAFAMNVAEHVGVILKVPIAIFSIEMSAQQLAKRLLCSMARVNYFRIRDGFLSERDFPALQSAASQIAAAPIFIEDASGQSIQEIRANARRLKVERNIKVAMIDYLQIARSTSKRSQESRATEVSEISGGCKHLARELGISLIALSQVDRSVDKNQRKPRLSDLRESGAIENDGDTIMFLTREEMYAENEEQRQELEGQATIDVAKQRTGPVGEVRLVFLKEFTRFETRARDRGDSHVPHQDNLPI